MSHVIPLWLVQILNLHRWNCNVCGLSRKMTELNYVRNVDGGGFLDDACRRRSQALRTLGRAPIGGFFRLKYRGGSPTMSHVIPLWLVQILNLHRWNCNVCGLSRKMTELNYVRNVDGGAFSVMCVGAAARLSGPSGAACASSRFDGRCVLPDLPPFMASCQQVIFLGL